jgi:hypothetical protein
MVLAEAALYFGHLLILSVRRLISSFGVSRGGGGWDVWSFHTDPPPSYKQYTITV